MYTFLFLLITLYQHTVKPLVWEIHTTETFILRHARNCTLTSIRNLYLSYALRA